MTTPLKTFEAFRVDENLDVKKVGMKGDAYHITINGHEYGYGEKEGTEHDFKTIVDKFEKILKFSAGRALQWLKKNTVLKSGSKKNESEIFEKFGLLISETEIFDFDAFVQQNMTK